MRSRSSGNAAGSRGVVCRGSAAAALAVEIVCHAAHVHKIEGRNVVRGGAATHCAAAQRKGREKPGGYAHSTLRGGRVDQHARNGLFKAKFAYHFFIARMDGKGVAHAAVVQQGRAQFAGFVPVFHHIKAQQRGELFFGERILGANALFVRNKQAGSRRHVNASHMGDAEGIAAHNGGVHAAVAAFHDALDLFELFASQEVAALRFKRSANLVGNARFGDNGLLGSADGAIVKGLAAHDLAYGIFNIGAAFNVGRHVARAHTQSRCTGAVSGLDHAGAASGQNKIRNLHQFVGAFNGRHADAADQIGRNMAATQGALNDFNSLGYAVAGAGVRRKHNGVAGLERNKRLVNNRRGGVGRRHNTCNHAHGHGNLHHLAGGVRMQHANSLHVLDAGIDLFAGKNIFDLLVLRAAKACVFHCQIGQNFGLGSGSFGHSLDNLVHTFLAQLRKFRLGLARRADQSAGFLNGK